MEKENRSDKTSEELMEEISILEYQLRKAERLGTIGTLTGGIAHDFNNILFLIIGYAEMCLDRMKKDAAAEKYLGKILGAATRAKVLVEQINTFSRADENQKKPLKIQFIINESIKLLDSTLPSTLKINSSIDKKCGPVMADPVGIRQIFLTLCTNAYRAMCDEEGLLSIDLKEVTFDSKDFPEKTRLGRGPCIRFSISDTGSGMSESRMKTIFDFVHPDEEEERYGDISLSSARRIVNDYGGHISVYSELEEGTTFHVYLPVAESDADSGTEHPEEKLLKGTERILLVDDEAVIVEMVNRILTDLGYRVVSADDSGQAHAMFQREPEAYDLVITDMTMPGMTGVILAKEILAIRPDIPVILCSGFSDDIIKKKTGDVHIDRFIMKPATRGEIAEAVRQVLDNR